MTLEFRPPRDPEWRICRMLLPETFEGAAARSYLLAVDAPARRVVGAASFREAGGEIADFRLHVVPTVRRRGVGTEIVARVAQGALPVEGTADILGETGVEAFCARNAFRCVETLTTVEADTAAMRDFFRRLRRRLPVPGDARVVSLGEAPLDQVAALHAGHVAREGNENAWRARVADTPGMARSVIVMTGDEVAGVLLWDFEGATAVVRSRVVKPGLRGGWVNALVMAEAMERGCAAGAERVRFFYSDTNRDTQKLAARFGAERVRVVARFRRPGAQA